MFNFKTLTASLLLTLSGMATAAPVVYTDRTAFSAATTGTTTVDFEGPVGMIDRGLSYTVGGTTFTSDVNLYTVDPFNTYSPAPPSDYLNVNSFGIHHVDISTVGMTAIGFDFGTLNETFGTSTSVTVEDGLGNIYNIASPGQQTLGFFGFTSSVVLTSVRVTGVLIVLDNVTTGSAAAVPVPGSLALVALGLAGLGLSMRRRT